MLYSIFYNDIRETHLKSMYTHTHTHIYKTEPCIDIYKEWMGRVPRAVDRDADIVWTLKG